MDTWPRARKGITTKLSLAIPAFLLLALVLAGRTAGHYLVLDRPTRGDVIVVLAGDRNDRRYERGLQLLKDGDGQLLFVDANSDEVQFGQTLAAQAEDYIKRSAGMLADHASVCPIEGDSTDEETIYVQRCLQKLGVRSIILVTSDFHTRRALSIFRRRLPQYDWSVAGARDDGRFGQEWWHHREWAKTTVLEWAKLIWWQTVDRWRHPASSH